MSIGKTETKVYFYKNDYNRVCEEIYHHQHIETGGNLFGLWTTDKNVVVHAALGPGEKCKRTNVSFHQDIEYLSRVGTFLNKKFMLRHIGEWHSHHQLSLNKPSSRDNRTIRQNYPNGVKFFLVIIGNIIDNDRVVLSPYFFSENGNTCEKGKFEVLDEDSPFTTNSMIAEKMNEKAETQNHPYCSSPSPNNDQQPSASECSSSANGRPEPSATDTSSNSGKRAKTSKHAFCSSPSPNEDQQQSAPEGSGRSQPSTTVTEVMDTGAEDVGANGHSRQSTRRSDGSVSNSNDVSPGAVTRCTESTTLQIRIPPPDYQTSTMSQPTVRSPSDRTRTATPPDPAKYPSAYNDHSTTNSASATCTKSDDDSKQTRKEAILEKVSEGSSSANGRSEPSATDTSSNSGKRAETSNHAYCSSPSPNNDQQRSASECSSSANGRPEPSATDTSSNSGKRAKTSKHAFCSSPSPNEDQQQSAPEGSGRSQPSTTVTEVMDTGAEDVGANGHSRQSTRRSDGSVSNSNDVSPGAVTRCTESTTLQIRIPPPDYQTSTMSQPTVRSPSDRTRTATPPDPAKYPSAYNDHSTTNSASATCTKSDDDSKQTRKEAILEKVFDEIKSKFNDSGIDIERCRQTLVYKVSRKFS